ncbi:MAG TPA: alpha/beta fold hydrolase [Candidatus Limnocylindria bacterium]|nr:alpha/beta fold hydrolase [Candidatus Limnocylindria bacterium]
MGIESLRIASEAETLQADLYGALPARRAVILCHGQNWDGSGWRDIAPRFAERGVPALAINFRGYDGSSGTTSEFTPPTPWSPVTDLRAAKALLRERGAREIALVGASMGGHAVLASSWEGDAECIVSVSSPVTPVPDEMSRRVGGRKLYVCADGDTLGAYPNVLRSFAALAPPKTLLVFGGQEHSRGMFAAPYGKDAIDAIVAFVAKGL